MSQSNPLNYDRVCPNSTKKLESIIEALEQPFKKIGYKLHLWINFNKVSVAKALFMRLWKVKKLKLDLLISLFCKKKKKTSYTSHANLCTSPLPGKDPFWCEQDVDAINLTTRLLHFAAHQFHKFLPYPAPLRCDTQPLSIFDRAFIPLHFDLPLTLFKPFDLPNFASIRSLVYCNNIRKTLQANHFEVAINPLRSLS